jgi:hypothetical protein
MGVSVAAISARLPQPALHLRLFADGNVEPHPRRAFEMRPEHGAGREHEKP